jgi:hypothetical protein
MQALAYTNAGSPYVGYNADLKGLEEENKIYEHYKSDLQAAQIQADANVPGAQAKLDAVNAKITAAINRNRALMASQNVPGAAPAADSTPVVDFSAWK